MSGPETVDWVVARPPVADTGAEGLRERKKALTRQRLTDTATQMFLARGFDAVRVTEIAAACEVSEKTVYNYFPTKESLVLDRWESTAHALRAGLADTSVHPVDAVRRILAGELAALTSWLDAQSDTAAAPTTPGPRSPPRRCWGCGPSTSRRCGSTWMPPRHRRRFTGRLPLTWMRPRSCCAPGWPASPKPGTARTQRP